MNYNVLVGGSAGQGMDTLSQMFELIMKRKGYYVFSNKDYMSRIRGGHNFIQIRFSDEEVYSHDDDLDLIIALDKRTLNTHIDRLKENGKLFIDKSILEREKEKEEEENIKIIPIASSEMAKEAGNQRTEGTVLLGAVLKFFGFDISNEVIDVLKESFDGEIYEINEKAIHLGYESVEQSFSLKKGSFKDSILVDGARGAALGALAGGVAFYSAYPMTPSTSFMSYLSAHQKDAGLIVEQVEDEIAAINMAIGASYAGIRAMTGTSGGGFSLMTEALGLAGITETPLVVLNVQRPGPATGLPTRTEQSDLSFILTASHGEIPRMVISLRNPEHAFYTLPRALNLADKYQMLIIILSDQYLADSSITIKPYDFSKISIERHISDEDAIIDGKYKRYRLTENGVSPRLLPGQYENALVLADSDEHDENGHITESSQVRIQQMDKRMKKLNYLMEELEEPVYYGDENPENLIVAWGSLEGPVREAVERLRDENSSVGALVFGDIYPLPQQNLEKYSKNAKNIINIEMNYTGQLAKLIRQETGIYCNKSILKYDGRQMSPSEIVKKFKEEVKI